MRAVRFALLALLAACGGHSASGPTQGVTALAGPVAAEAGATVMSQRVDGAILDVETADATGHANVQIEPGAFVTVVFPALLDPLPTSIEMVTAPIASDGSELVIHGPAHALVPIIVAGLTVTGPPLAGAAQYTIDLGCNTQTSTSLPAVVGVIAPCEGTDTNLDVLVRAFDANHTLLGYSAGRVPIGTDQAGNAIAELDVASWQTTGVTVPVTQTDTTANVALDLVADTLAFDTPPISDTAVVWNGLVVDSSVVTATMDQQVTTQYAPGTPAAIAIGANDFLGNLAPGLSGDRTTLAFNWASLDESAVGGADAFDLDVTWTNTVTVTWDAVLPIDATQIAFPQLDSTTQQAIPPPGGSPIAVDFAAIDSSDLTDFDALEAAGIFANGSIVPTPMTGEIRTSHATSSL
jgi:hypothetical protein